MYYLLVFLIAVFISYLMGWPAESLSIRLRALDEPSERKVHLAPIPCLGGIAIFTAFIAAIASGLLLKGLLGNQLINFHLTNELKGIIIGGALIFAIGLVDDIVELSAAFKLIGQIVSAAILVVFGIKMEFIGNPFGGLIYLGSLGYILTILWVVGFINIINFIDGLDGLAAGISAIAGLSFFYFALQTGQTSEAITVLAIAGAALGFLRHNFHPAKLFMGDSGSMFLGFVFGSVTVGGVMKSIAAIALFAPLVIMGVPILDGLLTILRRYRSGQPVTQADKEHLHHRLLRQGFTQRQAVLIIYLWSIALSGVGLTLQAKPSAEKYLTVGLLLFLSFLFAEFTGFFNSSKKE